MKIASLGIHNETTIDQKPNKVDLSLIDYHKISNNVHTMELPLTKTWHDKMHPGMTLLEFMQFPRALLCLL